MSIEIVVHSLMRRTDCVSFIIQRNQCQPNNNEVALFVLLDLDRGQARNWKKGGLYRARAGNPL
jgi:hypothetical protein